MPIEIKELVIKATIEGDSEKSSGSSKGGGGGAKAGENIVDACVEKVLEILEKQKQR